MTKDETISHLRSLADALEQGKTVQFRHPDYKADGWTSGGQLPMHYPIECYRVKPEPREWWVEWKYGGYTLHVTNPGNIPGTHVVHVMEVLDE